MFELIAFGTNASYVILGSGLFFLIFMARFERYAAALFCLFCVLFLVFSLEGFKNAFLYIVNNPFFSISFFLAYCLIGAIYTVSPIFGKWYNFVFYVREKNREEKKRWLQSQQYKIEDLKKNIAAHRNNISSTTDAIRKDYFGELVKKDEHLLQILNESKGTMTPELFVLWQEKEKEIFVRDFVLNERISIRKPEPEEYKSRIVGWIAYWPIHLLFSLINDPFKAIGKFIYRTFYTKLKNISDAMWDKD
ncbi:MAG: hypothetical protein EKK64_04320 [Neisseriaceae bacterium]|nr:MAG: hypothetical protein EKK64_04320 [Neisseriaceae bacterium]